MVEEPAGPSGPNQVLQVSQGEPLRASQVKVQESVYTQHSHSSAHGKRTEIKWQWIQDESVNNPSPANSPQPQATTSSS